MIPFVQELSNAIFQAISIITLGIFADISDLIPSHSDPSSLALAWVIIIARLGLATLAVFAVTRKLIPQFSIPITLGVLAILVAFTQPWTLAEETATRIGGFEKAMSDTTVVSFTPHLLLFEPTRMVFSKVYDGVNMLQVAFSSLKNITSVQMQVPDVEDYKLTMNTISFDWMYYIIALGIILASFYVLKHVNKYLAVAVAGIEIALLFGISSNLVVTITLIGLFLVLAIYLFKKGYYVVGLYPVIVAVLLVLSMVSLPKNVLLLILMVLMYVSLIPVFYLIGLMFAGFGSIVEHREKLGMKVKPKKVIEEQAGEWDALAVAIVLSGLFLVSIALLGANVFGLATFVGLTMLVLK